MTAAAERKFSKFMKRPDARDVVSVLALFVGKVIPDADVTVGSEWVMSCMPGTSTGLPGVKRLAAITAHTTELLVVLGSDDPGSDFEGFINVLSRGGQSTLHVPQSFYDRDLVEEGNLYPSIGSSSTRIYAECEHDFRTLLAEGSVVESATRLYKLLAERGRVVNVRGHNAQLATLALDSEAIHSPSLESPRGREGHPS